MYIHMCIYIYVYVYIYRCIYIFLYFLTGIILIFMKNHHKPKARGSDPKPRSRPRKDKIQQALANSKKRHRMSMCKAVEMLDLAGWKPGFRTRVALAEGL